MDPADLGERDNWAGGHYELIMDLGPRDDSRLRTAMAALWSFSELEGAWLPATGTRRACCIGGNVDSLPPRL